MVASKIKGNVPKGFGKMKSGSRKGDIERTRSLSPVRLSPVIEGSPKHQNYIQKSPRSPLFHNEDCACYTCKKHQIKQVRQDEFITKVSKIVLIGSVAIFLGAFIPPIVLAVLSILSSVCAMFVLMFVAGGALVTGIGSALIYSTAPIRKDDHESEDLNKLPPQVGRRKVF